MISIISNDSRCKQGSLVTALEDGCRVMDGKNDAAE
jgi:hypothetical protein